MSGEKYFATTTINQDITHINGNAITQVSISQWISTHPNWDVYDDKDPDYYPSLICPNQINSATFTVDGALNSQIIAGSHPPRRPK